MNLLTIAQKLENIHWYWQQKYRKSRYRKILLQLRTRYIFEQFGKYIYREVVFSNDDKYYYVSKYGLCVRAWFSVEKIDKNSEKGQALKIGEFLKDSILVNKKDGESYVREVLGFPFWRVKTGKRKKVKFNDDLVSDYYSDYFNKEISHAG